MTRKNNSFKKARKILLIKGMISIAIFSAPIVLFSYLLKFNENYLPKDVFRVNNYIESQMQRNIYSNMDFETVFICEYTNLFINKESKEIDFSNIDGRVINNIDEINPTISHLENMVIDLRGEGKSKIIFDNVQKIENSIILLNRNQELYINPKNKDIEIKRSIITGNISGDIFSEERDITIEDSVINVKTPNTIGDKFNLKLRNIYHSNLSLDIFNYVFTGDIDDSSWYSTFEIDEQYNIWNVSEESYILNDIEKYSFEYNDVYVNNETNK